MLIFTQPVWLETDLALTWMNGFDRNIGYCWVFKHKPNGKLEMGQESEVVLKCYLHILTSSSMDVLSIEIAMLVKTFNLKMISSNCLGVPFSSTSDAKLIPFKS